MKKREKTREGPKKPKIDGRGHGGNQFVSRRPITLPTFKCLQKGDDK